MDRVVKRCCGLDVHKSSVTACVRVIENNGTVHQEIREFAATTQGLLLLRDWLSSFKVELVGMEATGVYWKPIYYMLEDDEFELWLLNAEHLRHVPGRKTDVKDAEWICQLVEHGLVRPSFVPPKEIRELRNLTRYRKVQIEERTREVQRLEKVLQDAGIKLSSVATRVLGVSGRAMLEALISGTNDPEVLAELARGRLRSKIPALKEALESSFSSHHALMASRILAHIDYLDETIAELSTEIEKVIAPFSEKVELLDTIPGVIGTVVSLVWSQAYRYRKVSSPAQRRQTRWVVFGTALGVAGTFPFQLPVDLSLVGGDTPFALLVLKTGFALSFLLVPLSIGVAVLRSRLFDIDVLINRTLVYGVLTTLLAAVYLGGVAATQAVFQTLTGQQKLPQLAIVASTLVIAALFNPLRRRIQSFIDRRFYRRKYDARKTLEAFSAKLRNETDLEALNSELVGVVGETMQPAHASLWLRPETASKKYEAPG